MNTGTGPAKTMEWTCFNIAGGGGNPGPPIDSVQFNNPLGTFDGDVALTWNDANDILTIDPADTTSVTAEETSFLSTNQSITLSSGQSITNMRLNQFIAPTINGVAGGSAETVTNASTVYIDGPPAGSNITLTNPYSLWVDTGNVSLGTANGTAQIRTIDQTSSNTKGRSIQFTLASGLGTGAGGDFNAIAGTGGATNGHGGVVQIFAGTSNGTGDGGIVTIYGGSANDTGASGGVTIYGGNSDAGTGGTVAITAGDVSNAGVTLGEGGEVTITAADGSNNGGGGSVLITSGAKGTNRSSGSLGQGVISFTPGSMSNYFTDFTGGQFVFVANTGTLSSGTTITNHRQLYVAAPTLNGVAGGATETVTNSATVYIDAAPTGSNITFTNGPYAIWVDAGLTRLDGGLAIDGSTTQNVTAGQWTPTTNNIANLDSSSAAEGQYMRVGATITGSIQLTVDPTTANTSTQLELDLPVASNFGATSDAAGSCGSPDIEDEAGAVRADVTSNELEVLWITNSAASHELNCSFSYQII